MSRHMDSDDPDHGGGTDRPAHPSVAATVLMVAVVVLLVAVSLVEAVR